MEATENPEPIEPEPNATLIDPMVPLITALSYPNKNPPIAATELINRT